MKNNVLTHPNKRRKFVLLFLSLFLINIVNANETKIQPFVKGSFEQILENHKDSPYILTFWSETCAYCMEELALFGQLIKQYPNVKIVSITTDPFLDEQTVNQILASKNLAYIEKWVFADDFAERLYFEIDPRWRGELPLTYFIDKNNKKIKHMGVIKEDELISWLSEQNNSQ